MSGRKGLSVLGVVSIIIAFASKSVLGQDDLANLTFPSTFKFGTATSAYQIEGGWNTDGKSENYWDYLTHTYPLLTNNENGDVACDSYHKYKDDVQMLKELGVNFYRFSLSWSRILPSGFANEVNEAGIQYYQNLLDGLEAANIQPMVTLFHWDIPMSLHTLGNLENPDIANYFTEYADVAFRYFGDRVKLWTTFNEPYSYCQIIFGALSSYFNYIPTGVIEYTCAHNLIKAHAKTYRLYEQKYKAKQGGRMSINLVAHWSEPASNSTEDVEAAVRKNVFDIGWFAHPIYHGNYPQLMIDNIARISALQNFTRSRLPVFTAEEIEYIKGTHDFFALNHYSTFIVTPNYYEDQTVTNPSYTSDREVAATVNSSWPGNDSSKLVPWGLRKQLKYLKDTYNNPEIIITENGAVDNGSTNDTFRIQYIKEYLNAVLLSIDEDNVNVTGYTYWGLMDDFEWTGGYTVKMGLYQVDFTSDNRTRTAKESASFYNQVIQNRCLLDVCVGPEAVANSTIVNKKPLKTRQGDSHYMNNRKTTK